MREKLFADDTHFVIVLAINVQHVRKIARATEAAKEHVDLRPLFVQHSEIKIYRLFRLGMQSIVDIDQNFSIAFNHHNVVVTLGDVSYGSFLRQTVFAKVDSLAHVFEAQAFYKFFCAAEPAIWIKDSRRLR